MIAYLSAPSQPPGNIEWNLTNSKIFLSWEHVKAMGNESEVTGYKVSVVSWIAESLKTRNKCTFLPNLSSYALYKWLPGRSGNINLSTFSITYGLSLSGRTKLKSLFPVIWPKTNLFLHCAGFALSRLIERLQHFNMWTRKMWPCWWLLIHSVKIPASRSLWMPQ